MGIIKEIADECFETVAAHHADKIREGCDRITEDQVKFVVRYNWDMIAREVADLYATVVTMMEDTEIQF